MVSRAPAAVRQYGAAFRALILFTLVLGLAYPLVLTGVSQVAFARQANGSVLDGGSSLLGQSFTDADGNPLRQWFQPRPSAGGYDPSATGASNLGPNSPDQAKLVAERRAAVAEFDGVEEADVAPDALTASGSGLDPHISPEYARQQVRRVAEARGLPVDEVRALVAAHTQGRILGFLGEDRVNVVELNIALQDLSEGR
ncbi:potassium-transporting ATPase subunit KdpC [Cryptosporangium aurantiacum]|uniref:Potassium-transporting ATPase KdpC subunit n=1 Tax=Cryptosporangium aurantiacum TaxID=134849 RepID=A0A1M7J279_9ACTN|nr:potassium-transporting ATPase subunit KdpC [Cryptosporangium aurantiacum]SHM47180.1 K+-transporting ATPase ATPase C chain [Cryptosporangium aurantiacum]